MIDQKRLVEKAAALGIDAAPCAAALDEYAALLVAYNEKVNLTAITATLWTACCWPPSPR